MRSASAASIPAMVGIEQIARAAPCRIERRAVLPAIEIAHRRARVIKSLSAKISSTAARSPTSAPMRLGLAACHFGGNGLERFAPGRRPQPAVLAHIGLIEPLRAQAVDDVARLVGNPFLVDVVIGARQDAHHLAAAGIDADGAAERVHDVDRLGLVQLPRPRRERVRL